MNARAPRGSLVNCRQPLAYWSLLDGGGVRLVTIWSGQVPSRSRTDAHLPAEGKDEGKDEARAEAPAETPHKGEGEG